MEETYRFDDGSYDRLLAAGISWQHALHVLRTSPRVRHHIGAVLRVAGSTPDGGVIVVALIEEADDQYLVVGARRLAGDEAEAVRNMLKGATS